MKAENNKNPFELLNQVNELPPELKKQVMATINLSKLMGRIGQLFSIDMIRTAGNLIDQKKPRNK
ncbi:MAG: hypothetical protein RH860_11240 [Cytophagales bacterium]